MRPIPPHCYYYVTATGAHAVHQATYPNTYLCVPLTLIPTRSILGNKRKRNMSIRERRPVDVPG